MNRNKARRSARTPSASGPARPSRRTLAVVSLAVAAGLAAVWLVLRHPSAPIFIVSPEQNILLITIDTLRADALGAYGGRAATPNLDRLAAAGLRFTFAHAHAVMTLPAHGSILTGRYPFEHGARDNAGFRVSPSVRTLAESAKEKGFATGAFVGAFPLDRQFGLARGFDIYEDVSGQEAAQADFLFSERKAEEVVASAGRWIDTQGKPWFAWIHVFDPHSPYAPPPPYREQYTSQPYDGEVAYTDHALGPLLDRARRNPRPTTIVVTADHGEGLGDHGETTHGIFAYESTLRVPLIVAQFPGNGADPPKHRGRTIDAPARHVDVFPTIAGLAGLSVPDGLPGRSLLTLLDDDREDRPSYFEAMTAMLKRGWAPLRGVIADRTKYIELPMEEVYDLAADPHEGRNLMPAESDRARSLSQQLKALGAALPGEQTAENAEARARLQSLGYLSGSAPRKAQYREDDDPKRLIDVDRLMMQGIEFQRQGRTSDAVGAYHQVIARRPDMALAYKRLAYIQWEAGATHDAIATLRETLARNGRDADVEIRLGTYLAETGNVAESLPMLERAAQARPDDAEALNALGIAYARAGRGPQARATFERILAIDARNAYALENLGTVLMQAGDFTAARTMFERAVQNSPRSSRAHAGLGAVASHEGRDDEAIAHWKTAIELSPSNFDALFNLANTLIRLGRANEARPYATRFVQTAPATFYGQDIARFRLFLQQANPSGGPGRP